MTGFHRTLARCAETVSKATAKRFGNRGARRVQHEHWWIGGGRA